MPGTRRYLGVEGWMRARETTLSALVFPSDVPLTSTFDAVVRRGDWRVRLGLRWGSRRRPDDVGDAVEQDSLCRQLGSSFGTHHEDQDDSIGRPCEAQRAYTRSHGACLARQAGIVVVVSGRLGAMRASGVWAGKRVDEVVKHV